MLKGFRDFVNEDKVEYDFDSFVEVFKKGGYDLNKIVSDLKEDYNVTLKPCTIIGRYNESELGLEMCVEETSFQKIYNSHDAKKILSDIFNGLANLPKQSYFESREYKQKKLLDDAKARASGFKDQSDLTRAYYEK